MSLWSVAQASASISARSVVFSDLYGIAGAQEVGVADEERLLVVVGVDEPAGDAIRPVAAHLARIGVEYVHAVDLDLYLPVVGVEDVDVRLAEYHEQIALAGVLQVVGHVEVGVHSRLEHRDAPQAIELGGVRFIVEGASDQDVETAVRCLARRLYQVRAGHCAELWSDEDCRAAPDAVLLAALDVDALGAHQPPRPWSDGRELYPILPVRLLDAGGLQVLQDDLGEVVATVVAGLGLGDAINDVRRSRPRPRRGAVRCSRR